MGESIIKQPNGKYMIWSSTADEIVAYDAHVPDLISYFSGSAVYDVVLRVMGDIKRIDEGHTHTPKYMRAEAHEALYELRIKEAFEANERRVHEEALEKGMIP